MTGYGKSEIVINGTECTIEAKCVNGRYLELSTRIPKEWSDKEGLVRETVRELVTRGSLNIFVRLEDKGSQQTVQVDTQVARSYVEALRGLQAELGLSGEVTIGDLVRFPAIFQAPPDTEEKPDTWPELRKGLVESLNALNTMRDKEGAELSNDFHGRLAAIEAGLVDVEQRSALRVPQERERLRERVRQVIDEASIDDMRMSLEITLLAEKLDIVEECVRLKSHIKHFRQYMADESQAGRKLNFLLQEMNREVNTIGSKSNDAAIALVVIGMKEELERMREQVQNVE
ncbi:MAG: YicC family protein [Candidatus Kapabacteria bacterium]|nr:YicC family protein [Candidatus Kapabacteria bacterium]